MAEKCVIINNVLVIANGDAIEVLELVDSRD